VASNQDLGDHLHSVGIVDGHRGQTCGFQYDEVYRNVDGEEPEEDMVSFSDMSAVLSLILQWMCGKHKAGGNLIVSAGVRAHSLLYMIDPVNSSFENMTDIAAAAGMTRANVSKGLMELRNQVGDVLPIRGMLARESYRRSQAAALKAGVHSSVVRSDLKSKRQPASS